MEAIRGRGTQSELAQIRQRENNAVISERSETTASCISPNQTPPSLISLPELRCRKSASMSATLISPGGKAYALTHTKISFRSRNLSSKPEFSRFSVIKFYVCVRLTPNPSCHSYFGTDTCHIQNHLFHSDCRTLF